MGPELFSDEADSQPADELGRRVGRHGYAGWVVELQRLRLGHLQAVLAFELENRAYFAQSITDRGDEFYEQLPEQHRVQLAEQDAGACAFYVRVDGAGTVLGRFNLYGLSSDSATVGYRVAQAVTGHGVATSSLGELTRLAATRYGLRRLSAQVAQANHPSRRVLEKAGFVPVAECTVGGRPGVHCTLDLTIADPDRFTTPA